MKIYTSWYIYAYMILSNFHMHKSYANFNLEIKEKDILCLHDTFIDQTLIVVDIKSLSLAIDFYIKTPYNNKIHEKNNTDTVKESFTTQLGGIYEFCISNPNNQQIEVSFLMKSGIAAKDFSQLPTEADVLRIDTNLVMLNEYSKEIQKQSLFFNSHQKSYDSLHESIVMGISYFSIIIIIIMLFLGAIEAIISRQIIISRKTK